MSDEMTSVSVCICTFRRPELLKRLLARLEEQRTESRLRFNVVISDNDPDASARPVVLDFAKRDSFPIAYTSEPRQNIALARNAALRQADGEFLAFIDDDELPQDDWLLVMVDACERFQCAGVLAPVRPSFDDEPARWIIDGGFFERPENPTGKIMPWNECRTGNVLLRRSVLDGVDEPFNPAFGTGGEDIDFFHRMTQVGHVFRWCTEGAVYETVPNERRTRRYLLSRALLRGRNNVKLSAERGKRLARSLVAAPAYLLVLPFTLLLGQHVFMKYAIKFCDHAGRILALVGLNPVSERM